MDTTSLGRKAEQQAAQWLKFNHGYQLLSKNWRTRTCEIDLVMKEEQTIHFIEVKYRKNSSSGYGLESISKTKLNRMQSATLEWLEQNSQFAGYELNISAIELTGKSLKIANFITSINYDN
jgi:uncharacterized protein (TIGR00252 family)